MPEPLERLRAVPFVRGLRLRRRDNTIDVRVPAGRVRLQVREKESSLTHAAARAIIAERDPEMDLVLAARYIPRTVAEALIGAGINFADLAGNIHLRIGNTYNGTVLGTPEPKATVSERRILTPADVQLLFTVITDAASIGKPVRALESLAGISKSKVAQSRQRLIDQGLLVRRGGNHVSGPPALVSGRLVDGYAQVLRPKLAIGRFRYPEKTGEEFLQRLHRDKARLPVRFALTGGPAAYVLQRYYRGLETPLFVEATPNFRPSQLRLLPDREGPVLLLRAFGEIVFWREEQGHTLAPPWLIYAELLNSADPRATEAAQEFREAFLV